MSTTKPSAVYFPGFNGIRFLAASAVLCHHIEQFKWLFGFTDTFAKTNEHPVVYQAGRLGVALFFVLSGFLITYLLLEERKSSGKILVANFYMRRVLRIWPLYFLIVALSFFVFPHISALYVPGVSEYTYDDFWSKFALFGLVMPNFAVTFFPEIPFCSHTWSIGVEEQFYLIWPWVIGGLRSRKAMAIGLAIALVSAGVFFWLRFGVADVPTNPNSVMLLFSHFMAHFRIGTMAIGGIGAYLVFTKHPVLKFIYDKKVQWIGYAILTYMLITGVRIPGLNYEGYAVFFAFVLVNLSSNPNSIFNLENRLCNFMGKISYGLYMYHPVAIVACLYIIRQFTPYNLLFSILLYISSFILTTLLAWVSYTYFEKWFLQFKDRFAPGVESPKTNATAVV